MTAERGKEKPTRSFEMVKNLGASSGALAMVRRFVAAAVQWWFDHALTGAAYLRRQAAGY